jgi:hypothetical protein
MDKDNLNNLWDEFKKTRKYPFPDDMELQDPKDRARAAAFLDHTIENFRFHLTTSAAVSGNKIEWEAKVDAFQVVRESLLGSRLPEGA